MQQPSQLRNMLLQSSRCLHVDVPRRTLQTLGILQLQHRPKFLFRKLQVLTSTFLHSLQEVIGPVSKHLVKDRCPGELGAGLDALEVLLQDENVELHAAAAVVVHARNLVRAGD